MKHAARLLAVLLPTAAVAAPEASIELRPEVEVAGPQVKLGEVAWLRTTDLALMRELMALPIGRVPAAGQHASVGRDVLDAWVRRRLGVAAGQLHWGGAAAVQVRTSGITVSGAMLAATAGAALRDWLQAQGERITVDLAHDPRDVQVPAGPVQLQVRPLHPGPLRKRTLVWVEVWTADRFVRAVPVSFDVAVWRDATALATPLSGGAPLDARQLAPRSTDVTLQPGALSATALAAPGLRTRHPLAGGAVLLGSDLEATPAVVRGQWASLRSGSGFVVSEARVEVLQDGRVGDSVRVRQPGAEAGVMGRVVAPGQLEIVR